MRAFPRLPTPWVAACLTGVLVSALVYSCVVMRDTLQADALVRDTQAARLLAAAIAGAEGDGPAARRVLEAAFDPARHDRIRLLDAQGRVLAEWPAVMESAGGTDGRQVRRDAGSASGSPPASGLASAPVMSGTRRVGEIQVHARSAASGAVWRDAVWVLALGLAAIGLTAGALLGVVTLRSRQGYRRLALAARRIGLGEPAGDALPLKGGWAALGDDLADASERITRLQQQVQEQAQAVARATHTDALTGLHTRGHFRALLQQALESEPPPAVVAGGSLLIVRLRRLEAMNLRVGYDQVDGLMRALAGVANSYPPRVAGAFAGRLNGGDVGLYLPVPGVALSTAEAIWAVMRTALMRVDPAADMAIGGVEGLPWGSASRALAAADEALARAEAQGAFSIVVSGSSPDRVHDGALGDEAGRQRIAEALDSSEVRLAETPVFGADGSPGPLECELQARFPADGPFEGVRPRLQTDARSLLTRRVDLATLTLVLQACAQDGALRCLTMSPHSAEDAGFLQEAGRLLATDPRASRLVCLRTQGDPARVQRWLEAVAVWAPSGVRILGQADAVQGQPQAKPSP